MTHAATINACLANITTRRAAIAAVRAEADAIIEQAERRARGDDRGTHRDDMRAVERNRQNSIAATIRRSVAVAFALSAKFATPATDEAATPATDEAACHQCGRALCEDCHAGHPATDALQAAGIVEPVTLEGLPDGIAAFMFKA